MLSQSRFSRKPNLAAQPFFNNHYTDFRENRANGLDADSMLETDKRADRLTW